MILLVVRRFKVGGELGGSQMGRSLSAGILVCLWFFYLVMSILQAYEVGGLNELTFGIDLGMKNPNPECNVKA